MSRTKVDLELLEYASFGLPSSKIVQWAIDKDIDVDSVQKEVYEEALFSPDFVETPIPTPEEWGSKMPLANASGSKRRFFDIRERIVDWSKTFQVLERTKEKTLPESLVFRSGAELGYGRSPLQNKLASAVLFWALDAAVRTDFPASLEGYGGYFIPVLKNFEAIRSTGQSEMATRPDVLQEIMPNDDEAERSKLQASILAGTRKKQDAGFYGFIYRGLPFGEYDYRRSVAIRVQRSRFSDSEINTEKGKNWMKDARLYFYICHMFETYRTSSPDRNNFCPAFLHSAIIKQAPSRRIPPEPLPLLQVTIHDYWDGTLDSVILEVKKEPFQEQVRNATDIQKDEIVQREINRIKTLCIEMESFVIQALAMGAGDVGKYRIVHGDFKMNNVVVKVAGDRFLLGIIDFGMVLLLEKNPKAKDGSRLPNGTGVPKFVRSFSGTMRNRSRQLDAFFDFSYFQYTVRHMLIRWVFFMVTLFGTTNKVLVDFCKKVINYFPCRAVLPLFIYFSDVEQYASRQGTGWILAKGTRSEYDIQSTFKMLGVTLSSSDYYDVEKTILESKYLQTAEKHFDATILASGVNVKTRWDVFHDTIKKRDQKQLSAKGIE
mgnify:CR=1 FL=1